MIDVYGEYVDGPQDLKVAACRLVRISRDPRLKPQLHRLLKPHIETQHDALFDPTGADYWLIRTRAGVRTCIPGDFVALLDDGRPPITFSDLALGEDW